uniref:FUN14 domain-containing protein 1 n=2 Tax=Lygus hesperus TaxID=30085 RepID=A0A0K8SUU4_LYGHE
MPTVTNRGGSSRSPDDSEPINVDDLSKEAKNLIDRVIKDVGKSSATKQLVVGFASGWVSSYLMMKVGKVAAVALGGGIILLQVASHNGYVKVNWDRLYKKVEQAESVIEAKAQEKGPKILNKVQGYVDRKLDKMETLLKKKETKARSWYHRQVLGDEDYFVFKEIHVFMASFILGMATGMMSAKII